MDRLPRIPTPPALRWREFRIRTLPVLTVAAVAAGCLYFWSLEVAPASFVGEVEAIRANLTSSLPGRLAKVSVDQFQQVKAGDPVAEVVTTDPAVLQSSLAVIKAEVELLRAKSDPMLDKEQLILDCERLRLDVLDHQIALASSRVQLQFAQAELDRVGRLYRGGSTTNVASETEYQIALRDRDLALEEIAQREQTVARMLHELSLLPSANVTNALGADPDTLRAAIRLEEENLRLTDAMMRPLILNAPVDGTVSMVYRRTGESIVAGEPILTITALQSRRIVAYVRPPLTVEPQVGMAVEVRPRTQRRIFAQAKIIEVGRYMDIVPTTLISPTDPRQIGLDNRLPDANARFVEVGIPLAVSLPESLNLRPGERVDLTLLDPDR